MNKDEVIRKILDAATTGKYSDAVKALNEFENQNVVEYEKWKKRQGVVWCANNAQTPAEELYELFKNKA